MRGDNPPTNDNDNVIQLKDQNDINLHEGAMVVIPKGVEHCPKSIEPSYVLVFDPSGLKSQGD